jgi:hypothetical protein
MRDSKEPVSSQESPRARFPRSIALGTAALAALALIVAQPARSVALGFLETFEAQRVVPLALTPDDLRQLKFLPNLKEYGTSRTVSHAGRSLETTDFAVAARSSGLPLRAPSYLPAGVTPTTQNVVLPISVGAFTFDRRKAAATAHAHGYVLAPMPVGLDGSTLQISFGPTVVTVVGDDASVGTASENRAHAHGGIVVSNFSVKHNNVFILQSATPKIASTGVSAATIESYVLAQPGISPRLAAAIQALGNPATTLPIPIPLGQAYESAVTIHGVPAVAIGDNTGIGSVVVWQERGLITAVGGTLPLAEVGRIAESMR